jgi:hypothetical protein
MRTSLAVVALPVLLVACALQPSPTDKASTEPASGGAPSLGSSAAESPSGIPAGWTELPASGAAPSPREDHAWTLGPDGATAYLFGGRDGTTVLDDLWAYSLATDAWRSVTPSGEKPPARFGHNAVWAPGIGLVVFAGQAGAAFFNDLWAYDPASNAWHSLPANGTLPVARYGSCGAIGPDGRLWISHGFTSEGQRFADTRAYDFETATWTDETPIGDAPIRRCLHACWWTDDGALTLYGGQTTGTTALGDLWRLARGERPGTNSWTMIQPAGESPADRNLYAAARWGPGTLVFGGQSLDADYLADTWWLGDDASTMPVDSGGSGPSGRSGSEVIVDGPGGRLLLFGGRDGESTFGDLWRLFPLPQP